MKADLRPGAARRGVAARTGGVASAGDRGATAAVCFDCDRRAATPADWAALPSTVLSPVSPSLQRQPADSLAAVPDPAGSTVGSAAPALLRAAVTHAHFCPVRLAVASVLTALQHCSTALLQSRQ